MTGGVQSTSSCCWYPDISSPLALIKQPIYHNLVHARVLVPVVKLWPLLWSCVNNTSGALLSHGYLDMCGQKLQNGQQGAETPLDASIVNSCCTQHKALQHQLLCCSVVVLWCLVNSGDDYLLRSPHHCITLHTLITLTPLNTEYWANSPSWAPVSVWLCRMFTTIKL